MSGHVSGSARFQEGGSAGFLCQAVLVVAFVGLAETWEVGVVLLYREVLAQLWAWQALDSPRGLRFPV